MKTYDEFKEILVPILRCPACRPQLPLEIRQGTPNTSFSGRLHTEYLACGQCGSQYPITEDLIPILFTPDLQKDLSNVAAPSNVSANIAIYDEISDDYSAYTRKSSAIGERMRNAVKKDYGSGVIGNDPVGPVFHLDYGCGPGHVLGWLKEFEFIQIGMDVSLKNLQNARRNTDCFVICGDACSMPFVNESVDVVTESSVLHHIGDWKSALKESIRVCRKSGRVVLDSEPSKAQMAWSRFAITVFNLRFPVYKLLSYVSSSKYIFRDTEKAKLNLLAEIHHQPGTGFPMDEFETIFADAGFCVEIIPYATPELNSIARPNWQAIVLNLLSARNPWNPKYGPITAIGYSK